MDDFIKKALEAGAHIKTGRTISKTYQEYKKTKPTKNISFKINGQSNFFKLARLSKGYRQDDIEERIKQMMAIGAQKVSESETETGMKQVIVSEPSVVAQTTEQISRIKSSRTNYETPRRKRLHPQKYSLIIDIENSVKAQESAGYEQWAKVFNLKQAAQALMVLQENGIASMDELAQETKNATDDYESLSRRITEIANEQRDINALQKAIGTYSKTKKIYEQYKKTGYSKAFNVENETAINAYNDAREQFEKIRSEKIPTIKELQETYRTLAKEKGGLYSILDEKRNKMNEMQTVRNNVVNWLEERKREGQENMQTFNTAQQRERSEKAQERTGMDERER